MLHEKISELIDENMQHQAELIRRNKENSETIEWLLSQLKPSLDREKDLMAGIMDLMKVRLTKCALAPRLESGCSEFCFVVIFYNLDAEILGVGINKN
ncbi:hypothetical protein EV2_037300 [Malus domestica]